MKKLLLVSVIAASVYAAHSEANIRWNYVGAGYTDAAGDGPYVEGSFVVAPNFVLKGEYSRQSAGPADFNMFDVGINYLTGFKLDFSPRSQTYLLAGVDNISGDADETGVYVGAGIKHPLTPQVELFTEASYHTIADNHGSLQGGVAYYLSPDWAVRGSLGLNSGDTKNEFKFGVSYQF